MCYFQMAAASSGAGDGNTTDDTQTGESYVSYHRKSPSKAQHS